MRGFVRYQEDVRVVMPLIRSTRTGSPARYVSTQIAKCEERAPVETIAKKIPFERLERVMDQIARTIEKNKMNDRVNTEP